MIRDYDKPVLNSEGKPLRILESAAHHCIRCIKKSRALRKAGYTTYGMGDMLSYGLEEYDVYTFWKNEKQFKNSIKMFLDVGIDIIEWNNEPDHPVVWAREVVRDSNMEDKVKIITDCHDLDSIRKEIIPIPERQMFNSTDAILYASQPIQILTNELHAVNKPNTVIYSYCTDDMAGYDEDKIADRFGLVYEGGANPPDDPALERQYAYRSLHNIMKALVEMGNEVHMYCGNLGAFQTYSNTGASVYPPTEFKKLMESLIQYKYGILIFNNEDGNKNQVNYTLTNKAHEYLQCGIPSLACWCPESERYVDKHKIGFVFKHLDEIGNCSQLESRYLEIMDNIKTKRKQLVMENFIIKLENLYAGLLGVPKKGLPDDIRLLHEFEYGKEDTAKITA